jgi:hypothetical protein
LLGNLIEHSEEGLVIDEYMAHRILEAKKYLKEYVNTPPMCKTGTMRVEEKIKLQWELFYAKSALQAFVKCMEYKGKDKSVLMFKALDLAKKTLKGGE